ncbi:MAG TPA: FG-GAP-like repeat-containing protein [Thermoanaerobaculia bacterium]|jgi:hypothetical protein
MRVFATAVMLLVATTLGAATFNVNSTADLPDLAPGDGACFATGGLCTFRAAVEETNALAGRDTINVPAGTYASANPIFITDRLAVLGTGTSTDLTMRIHSGSNAIRANVHVEMTAVELTDVRSAALLTLRNVTAASIASGSEMFGPVRDPYPAIRIYDSAVTNVTAEEALVVLRGSVMTNGQLRFTNAAAYIDRSSIVNSPIESIHSTTASRSDVVAVNSTFSGAQTIVRLSDFRDLFDLNYCTLAGGAAISSFNNGTINPTNSVFQRAGAVCDPCGENNLYSPDPLLGPLTVVNGKPVHPPLPGSPAIDSGNAPNRVDERGAGRPAGGAPDRGAYEVCSACPTSVRRADGDFNVDGRGDVLWRYEPTDELAVWLMNGTTILGSHYIPPSAGRELRAMGDFDGDGDTDLLFDGQEPVLFMNGITARTRSFAFNSPFMPMRPDPANLVATGDFDGDGNTDLVNHNRTTNALTVQLMYGSFAIARQVAAPSAEWSLVAAKDFTGDGRADIVWRNSTTSVVLLWTMNEVFIEQTTYLASPPPQWSLLAAGDFTGDGRADLLWRNSQNHDIAVWELDQNGNLVRAEIIARTPTPWYVRAVVKLNDDATDDLFWRHDGVGDNAVWLMAPGSGIGSAQYLTPVPSLSWTVVGPR